MAAPCAAADDEFDVDTIPVGTDRIVNPRVMADSLDDRVALVSVMAVNNEIGKVQSLSAIAALCAAADAVYVKRLTR